MFIKIKPGHFRFILTAIPSTKVIQTGRAVTRTPLEKNIFSLPKFRAQSLPGLNTLVVHFTVLYALTMYPSNLLIL